MGPQPHPLCQVRDAVPVPIAAEEQIAVLIALPPQEAADAAGQLLRLIGRLHRGPGREDLRQLVQGRVITSVALLRGDGVAAVEGQVPRNPAGEGPQEPGPLGRDAVPQLQVGVVDAFLHILRVRQDVGRHLADRSSVAPCQLRDRLLRARPEQRYDLFIVHTPHFLSWGEGPSPYPYSKDPAGNISAKKEILKQ